MVSRRPRPRGAANRAELLVGDTGCWPARCDDVEGPAGGPRAAVLVGDAGPLARALRRCREPGVFGDTGPLVRAARRCRGPRRWPARGAVCRRHRRHRLLARALRRRRGPGRWPAREAVDRQRRAVGPRAATMPRARRFRARALARAQSCCSAARSTEGPGVGRRAGPGVGPGAKLLVGTAGLLVRATRRHRGPGRWPGREAVDRHRRAVGPRHATAPGARALARARSCWSAAPENPRVGSDARPLISAAQDVESPGVGQRAALLVGDAAIGDTGPCALPGSPVSEREHSSGVSRAGMRGVEPTSCWPADGRATASGLRAISPPAVHQMLHRFVLRPPPGRPPSSPWPSVIVPQRSGGSCQSAPRRPPPRLRGTQSGRGGRA